MKKLAIMSDLHIDLNQFGEFEVATLQKVLEEEQINHLHIAGDIANRLHEIALPFIERLSTQLPVTFNLGNHDMLGLAETAIQAQDFQLHTIGNRQLLAFHGWYDYSFSTEDFATIERTKRTYWFDRRLDRGKSDPEITHELVERLDTILKTVESKNLVVATHFVPHQQFRMRHELFVPFNAFLGSQRFHELFQRHQVRDVVFGHAHRRFNDHIIDGVHYHARPLGYIREWSLTWNFVEENPQYNPDGTFNPSKRYRRVKQLDRFIHHKEQMLATEFRQAMTILDC